MSRIILLLTISLCFELAFGKVLPGHGPDGDSFESTKRPLPLTSLAIHPTQAEYTLDRMSKSAVLAGISRSAPEQQASDSLPQWYDMIANVPMDMWLFAKHDVWNSQNVPHFIGLGALTGVLLTTDDATWRQGDKWYNSNSMVTRTSIFFKEFGDGRTQFGLAAAFAAYGWIGGNARSLRTASQIVEVVLGSGGVVQILKHMTGRESPFVSTAPGGRWRVFPNQIQYHKHVPAFDAMPSGHICTSVATFVVIIENYPECKSWMVPLAYVLTASIGVGMVNTGIHWYSDYPFGIAIGYAFGELVSHRNSFLNGTVGSSGSTAYSVMPFINETASGLSVNLSF
jgi:membrane-associated PAP2 superfamily phosphatase